MAEPENHTLVLLREIRETVSGIARVQDEHGRGLEHIETRVDEMHDSMVTALGLAAHANVRHDTVEKRLTDLTKRVERLEKKK